MSAMKRRGLLVGLLGTTLAVWAAPATAQSDYPSRPVRIIIPYPAAGITDTIVRPLAERLTRLLGQPFVVENRSGAGGAIGAEMMAKAQPDGYTIMMTPQTPIAVLPN